VALGDVAPTDADLRFARHGDERDAIVTVYLPEHLDRRVADWIGGIWLVAARAAVEMGAGVGEDDRLVARCAAPRRRFGGGGDRHGAHSVGMTVASFVIACLALVAAGWSYWRSNVHAARSAASSERSAVAAERSAAASEAQANLAAASAERYEIPWSLVPDGGATWRLTNMNRVETAYGVSVEPVDPSVGALHDAPIDEDIGPGAAVVFFGITPSGNQSDTRVRVTWRRGRDGEPELSWTHPTG
jgi:hypothetical protein